MICPCKACEKKGCGSHHEECEPYQAWKVERQDVNKWLRDQIPQVSETAVKGRNEKLKHAKSRKWNLKNQYGRGES